MNRKILPHIFCGEEKMEFAWHHVKKVRGLLFILFFLLFSFGAVLSNRNIKSPLFSFESFQEEEKVILKGTSAPSKITQEEVWTKDKSPYILDSDIEITESGSLTIDPGVIIYITPGRKIEVLGKIFVNGNSEEPVQFLVNHKKPKENKWLGIYIKSNEKSAIEGAFLEAASVAINIFPESKVKIRQNIFSGHNQSVFANKASIEIQQNFFKENKTAISVKSSTGAISENIFDQNNTCIFLGQENKISVSNNFFKASNALAVKYAAGPDFYLGSNYFDTQDLKVIRKKVYDGNQKSTFRYNNEILKRGFVIFEPFLKEKPPLDILLGFTF